MTEQPARRPRPGRGVEGERDAALGRLAAVAELHRHTVGGLCSACLLPWPCPTYQLATATTPGDET